MAEVTVDYWEPDPRSVSLARRHRRLRAHRSGFRSLTLLPNCLPPDNQPGQDGKGGWEERHATRARHAPRAPIPAAGLGSTAGAHEVTRLPASGLVTQERRQERGSDTTATVAATAAAALDEAPRRLNADEGAARVLTGRRRRATGCGGGLGGHWQRTPTATSVHRRHVGIREEEGVAAPAAEAPPRAPGLYCWPLQPKPRYEGVSSPPLNGQSLCKQCLCECPKQCALLEGRAAASDAQFSPASLVQQPRGEVPAAWESSADGPPRPQRAHDGSSVASPEPRQRRRLTMQESIQQQQLRCKGRVGTRARAGGDYEGRRRANTEPCQDHEQGDAHGDAARLASVAVDEKAVTRGGLPDCSDALVEHPKQVSVLCVVEAHKEDRRSRDVRPWADSD